MIPRPLLLIPVLLFLFPEKILPQTDTLFNQTDGRNLKQGWWQKTYGNGKLMYKGFFRDDRPAGEMRRYYESGALKAVLLYDDSGNMARATLYYENGLTAARGLYYNTLKDSIWDYYSYYSKSLTARETFARGVREGIAESYYPDGSLSEKLEWKKGLKHGLWEQYFDDGTLKLRGQYINGMQEGDFLVNGEEGQPYLTGAYLNDRRNGRWTFHDGDGNVQMTIEYVNGVAKDATQLDEKQQELFRMIDENKGTFNEPDEEDFLMPQIQ